MSPDHSPEALTAARAALAAADPALARVHAVAPPFAFRLRPGGFAGLLRLIVEQQVSTASAAAIWARLEAGLGVVAPEPVTAAGLEGLRRLGLSLPKARYALSLAQAEAAGRLNLHALPALDDEAALAALTAQPGIGPWTARIYLMFCEGRLDLFPAGDVALQEAMRWMDGAPVRPDARAAEARARGWSPHRSVAAHLLWAWYGAVRRGELAHPAKEAMR